MLLRVTAFVMVTIYNLEHEMLLVYIIRWRTNLILFFDCNILEIYEDLIPQPFSEFYRGMHITQFF